MIEPIRILQIVPNMQAGGLETLIMNIYRNIDRKKVQFDFLVHYNERKHYDDEIEELGGKIYRFSLRDNNNIIKYKRELNNFFNQHSEYKVIHCHMASIGALVFKVAKKHGIKVRIAHSHNSSTENTLKGKIKRIMMFPYKKYSTLNLACSTDAGKYLYGNKPFVICENAIDIDCYKFNQHIREKLRNYLNIDSECFVIGNVGRFNIQKNHMFLLETFKEFKKDKKTKLLLIGSGEKKQQIVNFITENKMEEDVIILENKKDVYNWYNVMDCFVLPSLFEGLPLVAIEAQANGLPCYFSNTITKETNVSNKIQFLSIKDYKDFSNSIKLEKNKNRDSDYKLIYNSNYNIKNKAKDIQNLYIKLHEEVM